MRKLTQSETTLAQAASKAGMDEKTARKYRQVKQLPSLTGKPHGWRTRPDPFEEVGGEIEEILRVHPTVQAKTMFEYLGRKYPGRFQEGQLRSLQRRFKQWRVGSGPEREVMFPQVHDPGRQCQSDFTGFWCRQPTGLGDNEIWRISTLHGILYLPAVGSKTTSFSSAFAGIFASN